MRVDLPPGRGRVKSCIIFESVIVFDLASWASCEIPASRRRLALLSGRRPANQDRPASSYCSMAERNRRDCTAVISSGSAIRPKEAVSEKWSPQVMDGRRRSAAARNDHRQCVGYVDVCQITTVHRGNQDAYQHAPRAKRSYENKEKGEKAACLTPHRSSRTIRRAKPAGSQREFGRPA